MFNIFTVIRLFTAVFEWVSHIDLLWSEVSRGDLRWRKPSRRVSPVQKSEAVRPRGIFNPQGNAHRRSQKL